MADRSVICIRTWNWRPSTTRATSCKWHRRLRRLRPRQPLQPPLSDRPITWRRIIRRTPIWLILCSNNRRDRCPPSSNNRRLTTTTIRTPIRDDHRKFIWNCPLFFLDISTHFFADFYFFWKIRASSNENLANFFFYFICYRQHIPFQKIKCV